jgi:hypothetical protein
MEKKACLKLPSLRMPSLSFSSNIAKLQSEKKIIIKPENVHPDIEKIILTLINTYDLKSIEIDCFKILIKKINNYDLIKEHVINNFKFVDIIKLMYSKCNTNILLSEKKLILDYLNYDKTIINKYDDDTQHIKEDTADMINEYNKFNNNMTKLNNNIDFLTLGDNIIRNDKIRNNKHTNNKNKSSNKVKKNSNNYNLKNTLVSNNNDETELEDDTEFVDVHL